MACLRWWISNWQESKKSIPAVLPSSVLRLWALRYGHSFRRYEPFQDPLKRRLLSGPESECPAHHYVKVNVLLSLPDSHPLVRCACIPYWIDLSISSSNALAENAIIGIRLLSGCEAFRIAFAASRPFITGI